MASFPGSLNASVMQVPLPGQATGVFSKGTITGLKVTVNDPAALAAPFAGASTSFAGAAEDQVGFPGTLGVASTVGLDFFESFHVVPRSLAFGNILSTTTTTLEVFSAFRSTSEFWTAFDNNAGAGVTLLGLPTLPVLVRPMAGFLLTVQVDLEGPAVVDSTLDFTFNVTGLISVPITLQRVVLLTFPPEMPYDETLEWATDVLRHRDGTEQRRALRKNPRQLFNWELFLDDGAERSLVENAIFDWQGRTFGIPVWHEASPLTAAVTGGSTTVLTVASTANADFRDGSLIVLYESQTKFDVLNLVSHTATTLTVLNPPGNSYTPIADLIQVAPLRLGVITGSPRGSRYLQGQERLRVALRVKDNDANLADVSTWTALNSKVLLDDVNIVQDTMSEDYQLLMEVLDNRTGVTSEYVRQDRNRRGSEKQFAIGTKAALWRVRQLLHALRGRQVSFYLPTFSRDLTPVATMTSAGSTLSITNVGYTNFVRSRQPRNIIRVVPTSGSAFVRTIQSSSIFSATQEIITITTTWPSTLTPAQIASISFVEEVRLDSDAIRIRHERGTARRITAPVRSVLE
jgi:hypothetical protein